MSIDQLTAEALQLPADEREKLAETLWHSLDEDDAQIDRDYDAELSALVMERDNEIRSGKEKTISHEEVMRRLKE